MARTIRTRRPLASRAKQLLPVDDLTGGLDLRRSPTLIDSRRGRTYLNCSLEEPGALTMRPGYQVVSTASLGSARAQGGERVYLAASVFSLVAFGGAVYRPTDAWAWGAAVHSTISSSNQVFFPFDRDLVMVMDGANRPRLSTNGTNWLLAGTDAPSSAAVLSSVQSGGGALTTGAYDVVYTFKHRGTVHESNPSSASAITLTASTANSIHAAASPSTDPKVDAYVWYARHRLPDVETVFRKASSGAASTVTILSSAWTSNEEAPTNHDVPPVGLRFGVSWKSRWWAPSGTVGNRLYFTEIFQPQSWPGLYFIDIPFTSGDSITAIRPNGDTLLVYGQSGLFLIIGQTSLDFEVRPSQGAETGAFGQRAVTLIEQASVHVSGKGVNSFDGAADRALEHDIAAAYSDLLSHTGSTALALIASVYDYPREELRIAVPRAYPTIVAGELVLNLDRTRENEGVPAWTTTDRDIAFYMLWDGNEPVAGDRGRLFSMPSTGGRVFEENVGASANSSNLTMQYESGGLHLGLHRSRIVDAHVEYEPHAGECSLEAVVDGVSQGVLSLEIGAGLDRYGTGVYGTAKYGGSGRRKAYTPLPLGAEGRTVTTKLIYRGQERMRIFTYAYGIVPAAIPSQASE